MNVDLDAIAQRGRCEVSSLRLALPLIEQGYTPPFLARYRRDELGGLDESSLWALSHAVRTQQRLEAYREELHAAWQATPLADPALGRAISSSKSRRLLDRLSRRVKLESGESGNLAQRLAVRLLSPEKGDGDDLEAIGASVLQSGAVTHSKPTAPAEGTAVAEPTAYPASTEEAEKTPETSEADASDSPALAPATSPAPETTSPLSAAIDKLDDTMAKRLSGDPRIMGAAVRWLSRQAKIHILEVSDPHGHEDADGESEAALKVSKAAKKKRKRKPAEPAAASAETAPAEAAAAEPTTAESAATAPVAADVAQTQPSEVPVPAEPLAAAKPLAAATAETDAAVEPASAIEPAPATGDATADTAPAPTAAIEPAAVATEAATDGEAPPVSSETPVAEKSVAETPPTETPAAETPAAETPTTETTAAETPATQTPATETPVAETPTDGSGDPVEVATEKPPAAAEKPATKTEKKASASAKPAKKKKVSPRQRRRRWLVSTLKPLAGKRMPAAKLSAFQVVMLGRALRSQVAQCAFDYDAAQLVAEMQKAASNLNRTFGDRLASIVLSNEAALREAAESAWWDEIQEQASARLVTIAADHLHRQINRGGVDAKVVMSIDAIGPRTAATSIVAADGRVLHNEDIPCQLSAAMRTLAVTKMGELIHQYQVDLIVISNGPARRACMIAVGELIKQSAEKSVRWTLADRSGADAYAGSAAGDQEMKSTPRRFRSAAWVAFATLQPSQAMVKVDPLKLRLGSFQRELSDQAVLDAVEDVLVSGASRGGVDVNSTAASWLERLPGMTRQTAEKIDAERREKLIASRDDLLARADWESSIHTRQALPFLRVFGSEETLDGTLIHPDDYPIAKRLAKSLELELPPASPPGYELPDYSDPKPAPNAETSETPAVESVPKELPEDDTKAFGPTDDTVATEDAALTPESETAVAPADEAAVPAAETSEAETEGSEASSDDAVAADESASESPVAEGESTTSDEDSTDKDSVAEKATSEEATAESAAAETADEAASEPTAPIVPEPFRQQKPERAKVEKLIKEWQVGTRRSLQIVSWLCEPFGDGANSGPAPAVMDRMPALADLKEGDQVIGVVVGVMPFGVFVELTPECSGLIHVSRVSDGFVEDLHEAVQVGDVVTAWVTGTDTKRRRVGLSAVSPQREAELQSRRQDARGPRRDSRGGDRGPRRGAAAGSTEGARDAGRTATAGGGRSPQGAAATGNRSQGTPASSGPRRDSRSAGGGRDGGGRGRPGGGGGRRDQQRGGGGRGPRRPEVYEVVGKEPDSAPLSDAMQEGKEPLRSFGDLMQLFSKDKPQAAAKPKAKKPKAEKPVVEQPEAQQPEAQQPEAQQAKPEGETKPSAETASPVAAEPTSTPAAAAPPTAPSPDAQQAASGPDTDSDESTT